MDDVISVCSRPAMVMLCVFVVFAGMLIGYNTSVVSGVQLMIRPDIQLSTLENEYFVSCSTLAAAVATLFVPLPSSSFGRRPAIFLAAVFYISGAATTAAAQNFAILVVGRVLLGVGIGFSSSTVPMYASEVAAQETRGLIVTLHDFSIVFGQLLAGLLNGAFSYVDGGWRWSVGLAAVIAASMALTLTRLPESPRWLWKAGRWEEAEAVLMQMASERGSSEAETEATRAAVTASISSLQEAVALDARADAASTTYSLWALWSEKKLRRASLLGILIMSLNQLVGINVIMYYSGSLFSDLFSVEASVWLSALCGLAQLVGVSASLYTIDLQGRRATALRSIVLVCVCLVALSATYFICDNRPGDGCDAAVVAIIMLYLAAYGSGISGVAYVVASEIYPLRVRATGISQAVFFNWIINYAVSQTFLSLVNATSQGGAFSVYASVSIVGLGLLWRYLPETSGLRLEDTETLFADPYPRFMGMRPAHRQKPPTESAQLLAVEKK